VIDATHAFATTMIFYLIIHPMAKERGASVVPLLDSAALTTLC
jgi:hypothetical protein